MHLKHSSFILIFLFLGYGTKVSAQTKSDLFIGIQPSITVEPFYEEGELDINLIPVVFEKPVGNRITLKLSPIVNYHIGGLSEGISDIALYAVAPVYLREIAEPSNRPFGFYIGPVLGFGRNMINDHYTITTAVEPGYLFETSKSFTISLGLQLGGSYFNYDSAPNKWVTHWGPKVAFGFWIGKNK